MSEALEVDLFEKRDSALMKTGWIQAGLKSGALRRPREQHKHEALLETINGTLQRKEIFTLGHLLNYFRETLSLRFVLPGAVIKELLNPAPEEERWLLLKCQLWGIDTVLEAIDLYCAYLSESDPLRIKEIDRYLEAARADLIKAGLVPPLIGKMPGLLIEKEAPRQDETDDP
jgi:hypothetical protein